MAFLKAGTFRGISVAGAYWRPEDIILSRQSGSGQIVFRAYASADIASSLDAKDNVLAEHVYQLTIDEFKMWFAPAVLLASGRDLYAQAYAFATARKDIVVTPASDGVPAVMASFFEGCDVAQGLVQTAQPTS